MTTKQDFQCSMFGLLFLTAAFASLRVSESSDSFSWFRPPAVPLIVVDPYLSLWSTYDNLYDGKTTHWNGNTIELTGFFVINGNCYRFESIPIRTVKYKLSIEESPKQLIEQDWKFYKDVRPKTNYLI